MTKQAKILWVDLEMTGLDAENDLILEVAAIATDWDFDEIATYQGVVKNEDMSLQERLTANSVFWDANPASKEGLVGQNGSGKDLITGSTTACLTLVPGRLCLKASMAKGLQNLKNTGHLEIFAAALWN
jgi:hypothetical protein